MDEKLELVRNWLEKAGRDLAFASMAQDTPEFLDMAAFHCQQAAEKALKGLLVFNDQRFTKTHELAGDRGRVRDEPSQRQARVPAAARRDRSRPGRTA
jgi:HEPN domain-containing protein